MSDLKPAEVFSPGDVLREELEARGWSQIEFAEIIDRSVSVVNDIVSGKRSVTPATANAFAAALGTSALFWMNLDAAYRLAMAEPAPAKIAVRARTRSRYPVRDMIARGWIADSSDPEIVEHRLLEWLDVKSMDDTPALLHAAKRQARDGGYEDLTPEQIVWLVRVKELAGAIRVKPYSERRLRAVLDDLQACMTEPEEARNVPGILEDCGIRFVVVEPLRSSKIDGVCFWLDEGMKKPVIGMSLRLDRIDNFWFVLRHEIEHVLSRHAAFDSDVAQGIDQDVREEERQANLAAAEFCVAQGELADFIQRKRPIFSEKNVVGFARRLEIHPGIVVGQLQHKINRYDLLRKHLVKVREFVTPAAVTDGYGRQFHLA